jgi:hypothetical protein
MRVLVAMMCAGLLAGCSLDKPRLADEPGRPLRVRVAGVPFHPQDGFRCGPAGMAMMLGWAGVEVMPSSLAGQFYGEPKDPRTTLVDTARRYGRFAYPIAGSDALISELAAGHPVLVLENLGVASEPIWNCMVAVGYDRQAGRVALNSGGEPGKTMSVSLLERLWAETNGWGMVVLRPGDLPATATRPAFLDAARGLEKSGNYWEAVRAYDTALSQWPSDPEAMMGLGSSLYLLGDPHGAAEAFQTAAKLAKDPKPALEALAHIQAELARRDDAVASADKVTPIHHGPSQKPRRGKGDSRD